MRVHGSCHCGAITYEADVDPALVGVCSCTDCQTLSGSPFRVSVPTTTLRVLTGRPKTYVKTAESGSKRRHAFCGDCGAPVYSSADVDTPPLHMLRVGCLAERAALPPQRQIWRASAVPWVRHVHDLPGADRQ